MPTVTASAASGLLSASSCRRRACCSLRRARSSSMSVEPRLVRRRYNLYPTDFQKRRIERGQAPVTPIARSMKEPTRSRILFNPSAVAVDPGAPAAPLSETLSVPESVRPALPPAPPPRSRLPRSAHNPAPTSTSRLRQPRSHGTLGYPLRFRPIVTGVAAWEPHAAAYSPTPPTRHRR